MARPREFDLETAVSKAMNVFWTYGYDSASVSILLGGMGLTKGSFYKAFTDKKTLFLTAMTSYDNQQVASAIALLNDTNIPSGKERIARLFRSIPIDVAQGDRRGCLLCSAAAGPAADDSDISALVDGLLGQIRDGFRAALGASKGMDQREKMAKLLVTQYVGLRILSRAQTPVSELSASVEAVIELIDED